MGCYSPIRRYPVQCRVAVGRLLVNDATGWLQPDLSSTLDLSSFEPAFRGLGAFEYPRTDREVGRFDCSIVRLVLTDENVYQSRLAMCA